MNYALLINILEVALLAGVFVFLFRFIFSNYASKVRKPAAWVHAAKEGRISADLLRIEKKYPDRIRFYSLWLQAERLKREKVEGSSAELGVYRGETALLIHLCDPSRNLHLFDTFEGFPSSDLREECGKAAGYTTRHFADTSAEKVRAKVGNHDKVFIHQGYFPDTVSGLENEKFALVSLDADLEKPTRAGLEYFYPRLSPGGVILIHDYNDDWPGLMRAVDEFCVNIAESLIPIPDADSTVMIVKNNR